MTHASDLHVERIGSGPPLVLIHGIGSRAGAWRPVMGKLAREREVFAIDLPGFASSPPLPAGTPSSVHTLTDAVEAWFEKMGLDRPRVAGNSLGGAISLELARRGAVHSATALSPAGFWIPIERSYARSMLQSARSIGRRVRPFAPRLARSRALRSLLGGPFFGRPWRVDVDEALLDLTALLDAPAFDETLEATRSYDFARGEEIHVPVTIAWGTRDLLLLPQQARRAKRLLPNARHVPLHGCGHVPMADDPEAVARVLLLQ